MGHLVRVTLQVVVVVPVSGDTEDEALDNALGLDLGLDIKEHCAVYDLDVVATENLAAEIYLK